MSEEKGRVSKIAGPVVDVAFPLDALPELNFALEVDVTIEGQSNTIILEVAQHLGEGKIRAISMQGTDGLQRGAEVTNTGAPISVPVGPETLGHIFNVWGDALDVDTDSLNIKEKWPIHRTLYLLELEREHEKEMTFLERWKSQGLLIKLLLYSVKWMNHLVLDYE